MKKLLVIFLISTVALAGREERHVRENRRTRVWTGSQYAFFEAFPASGAGTSGACSTTAPTGAKGEALTFTRASNGTCTKTASGGLATTGIADGDLVVLGNNVSRVEYDSAGTLGLRAESGATNLLPRFDALTDAAWSDVGAPSTVDGATDPFGATTGDTITDSSAVALEGRSQPVTVVAASAQIAYCYLKAGTLAKATLSLDGTTASTTTLSPTAWSILQVADASASGVSVSFQVLAGSVVGDTGSIIVGGCQVEAGTDRSAIVPTAAGTASRVTDGVMGYTLGAGVGPDVSLSASIWFGRPSTGQTTIVILGTAPNRALIGRSTNTAARLILNATTTTPAVPAMDTAQHRIWLSDSNGVRAAQWDSVDISAPAASMAGSASSGSFGPVGAIISQICIDPSPSRCR